MQSREVDRQSRTGLIFIIIIIIIIIIKWNSVKRVTVHTVGYIFMIACCKWMVCSTNLLCFVYYRRKDSCVFQNTAILFNITTQTWSQEAEAVTCPLFSKVFC